MSFNSERVQLENDSVQLGLLPGYGCYWTDLKFKVRGEFLEFLVPIPNQKELMREPFGSFLMAPWVNRLENAKFRFQDEDYVLKPNFPDGTAIHGDVKGRQWNVIRSSAVQLEVSLDTQDYADFNYPFHLVFIHSIELSERGFMAALFMQNMDTVEVPVGFGFHPFFKRKLTQKDEDVMLALPAEIVYPDKNQIPVDTAQPVSSEFNFIKPKFVGNPNLDHCFTGLLENKMKLIYPGTQVKLVIETDPIFSHSVIYAPNDERGKPKNCIAVEPQTHVNNGFNLFAQGWKSTGVKVLKPGETWGGSIRISVAEI